MYLAARVRAFRHLGSILILSAIHVCVGRTPSSHALAVDLRFWTIKFKFNIKSGGRGRPPYTNMWWAKVRSLHYNVSGIGQHGPVAQLDRALRFERRGWEFKSLRVHHAQFFRCAAPSNLIWFAWIRLAHRHVRVFNRIGFAHRNVIGARWRFIDRRRRGIGKLV
jgi:hypothetical protein